MLHSAALGHLEVVGNELNLISVMPIDSQLPHTELRNHPWTAHSPRFACSVGRLHQLCRGLDDAQLEARSYCRDWSIAGTLSHLGSRAVIMRRRLEDVLAGRTTPFDFAPSVWDEWEAKSARAKADDALVADEAVLDALEAVSPEDRSRLTFPIGPGT